MPVSTTRTLRVPTGTSASACTRVHVPVLRADLGRAAQHRAARVAELQGHLRQVAALPVGEPATVAQGGRTGIDGSGLGAHVHILVGTAVGVIGTQGAQREVARTAVGRNARCIRRWSAIRSRHRWRSSRWCRSRRCRSPRGSGLLCEAPVWKVTGVLHALHSRLRSR